MAEEKTHGVQNKWLLLIAIVLGLMTVFIYQGHIKAIRAEQEGQKIAIIEITKDLQPGEKVTARHIKKTEIPKVQIKGLGNVMNWDKDKSLALNKPVNQPVRKGQFLLTEHLYGSSAVMPSRKVGEGMVAIPVEFNANESVGDALSPGDTVNLKGVFSLQNRQFKTYRIISYVRVLNVGGRGTAGDTGSSSSSGMKNYRKIVIEVTPEVSIQLTNVLSHIHGDVQLELNRSGAPKPKNAGQINEELKSLAERAQVGRRR